MCLYRIKLCVSLRICNIFFRCKKESVVEDVYIESDKTFPIFLADKCFNMDKKYKSLFVRIDHPFTSKFMQCHAEWSGKKFFFKYIKQYLQVLYVWNYHHISLFSSKSSNLAVLSVLSALLVISGCMKTAKLLKYYCSPIINKNKTYKTERMIPLHANEQLNCAESWMCVLWLQISSKLWYFKLCLMQKVGQ